jgi:hypothetical protein
MVKHIKFEIDLVTLLLTDSWFLPVSKLRTQDWLSPKIRERTNATSLGLFVFLSV